MPTDEHDSGSEVRFFLAIAIPPEVRKALMSTQAELKTAQARVAWVPDENLHLSLAFLGAVREDRLSSLMESLTPVAAQHRRFETKVSTIGAFGRPRRPRVIWSGCDASVELMKLYTHLLTCLKEQAFSVDERPYRPHITLGRVRDADNIDALNAVIERHRETLFGTISVDALVLYKSTLRASQAVHEPLHRAELA